MLLCVNLLFVPQRSRIVTWDTNSAQTINERKKLFLSPVWARTYNGHFLHFGSILSKKKSSSAMADYNTFKSGRIIGEKNNPAFLIESYDNKKAIKAYFERQNIATGIPTDLDFNPIASPFALDIWAIFFLIPSLLIYYFSVFYKKR